MNRRVKESIELLESGYSFVSIQDSGIYKTSGMGVKPIMEKMRINIDSFKKASVADKIIGKAAALLLVLSGAEFVYGKVMSKTAVEVLEQNQIDYQYGTLVDVIQNRTHTGLCPLEDCVFDVFEPRLAYARIEERINELMSK